ncbi:filamentous hemagglutinin N-terminal domain-containing protein [Morganella morganii]|uniref:two-partner secretion domain-containing protein n=1 Tax=Morganella morganii TaxID=582 RepID=UPI001BDA5D08|nr:filamentous hemagglutinin N-terminal domain-containing protein [Morganella morganii]MBT0311067.1 filamentous hemagglutinin N-terminal domain-containing protein [Morganella morganii subsp. morganii]
MPKIVKLSVISSTLFLAQFASAADITVNPASSETTQVVRQGSNTTINIAPANTQGVSYNAYDQFNVGKNGVVFNNRESGAGMIINEVLSTEKSQLRGNMHVDGKKAHLIIANPNGIACNGCSVTGVNSLNLAVGNVSMTPDGQFSGYRNISGKIRMLNTAEQHFADTDKLTLVAAAIDIKNSQLKTKNLATYIGHYDLAKTNSGLRDLEMINPDYSLENRKNTNNFLNIKTNSHIKADNMYIHSAAAQIRNAGQVTIGPELQLTDPEKTPMYGHNQLTMDLYHSGFENKSSGKINTLLMNTIMSNSSIENNGQMKTNYRNPKSPVSDFTLIFDGINYIGGKQDIVLNKMDIRKTEGALLLPLE